MSGHCSRVAGVVTESMNGAAAMLDRMNAASPVRSSSVPAVVSGSLTPERLGGNGLGVPLLSNPRFSDDDYLGRVGMTNEAGFRLSVSTSVVKGCPGAAGRDRSPRPAHVPLSLDTLIARRQTVRRRGIAVRHFSNGDPLAQEGLYAQRPLAPSKTSFACPHRHEPGSDPAVVDTAMAPASGGG